MTKALYLPNADRSTRWFLDDYPNQAYFSEIEKLLWHSTETRKTSGCPGYSGGSNAPQVTINPWPGYFKTWQHYPLNRAGRALGNPSSTPVSENKDDVLQVEVIGFSDPALGRQYGCYLPELPAEGIAYLAAFAAFVTKEWSIRDLLPPTWPLYKVSSWAAMDAAHMSSSAYDAHRGWLAHMHAPKPSTHGDAALPIVKIREKTRQLVSGVASPTPPPTTPPPTTTIPTITTPRTLYYREGNVLVGSDVKALQSGLRLNFPLYAGSLERDGRFGPATDRAVREFQKRSGLTVDGRVGPNTREELSKYRIKLY